MPRANHWYVVTTRSSSEFPMYLSMTIRAGTEKRAMDIFLERYRSVRFLTEDDDTVCLTHLSVQDRLTRKHLEVIDWYTEREWTNETGVK